MSTDKKPADAESWGQGPLFTDPDVESARRFFRQKSRKMTNKLMDLKTAIATFVKDGDYIATGGFGGVRIPTAALHEIVRQGRKNLGLSGHTTTHDFQILAAGECIDRVDAAYVVGLEARGLSKCARRLFEEGRLQVTEWTNGALAWRYRAAAMGVSFLPVRVMGGTDTGRCSAAQKVTCPFTGVEYVAVPALFPDVGLIHVHRSDIYGNCQIDGITIADFDMARAAKRLIITAEEIISNDEIRRNPDKTIIPYFCVDAVVEVPYGSYPGNMPYRYFSDEDHLREWMQAERDPETLKVFLDKHIYNVSCFEEYIELCGGTKRMLELKRMEKLVGEI
ncbi:MAG: hypothetical protein K6T65_05340 [Peptococcaceae bacterium]|nr:hypothetical protein [Peptococcaceae bacterium]